MPQTKEQHREYMREYRKRIPKPTLLTVVCNCGSTRVFEVITKYPIKEMKTK